MPVSVIFHVGVRTTDSSQGSPTAFLFRLLGLLLSLCLLCGIIWTVTRNKGMGFRTRLLEFMSWLCRLASYIILDNFLNFSGPWQPDLSNEDNIGTYFIGL